MKIGCVGLLVATALAGCAVKAGTTPSASRSGLPFDPATIQADPVGPAQVRGSFKVELSVRVTRDLTEADNVALRVVSSGKEIARAPVIVKLPAQWNGAEPSKVFSTTVGVPQGDYEVELVYLRHPILGHAFKIAEVPVWGGGRQLHFFWHQKTRVDLDKNWLRLARWVVEDEPTQAFVIEWWKGGKRVVVTTGRTDPWKLYRQEPVVQYASASGDAPRRSVWTFGEERYAIPKDLTLMGGSWEARVYREGAPPVAVAFELSTSPETQETRVALKKAHLSAELFLRPLPAGLGDDRFAAIPGKQHPTEEDRGSPLVDPIGFDRGAVRALFRSPELARKWLEFLEVDGKVAKAKRLRPQILALIKKYSGPWQPGEVPR